MILRDKEGGIRVIWRLLLLVGPFLMAAFLLRYVPIRIQTRVLMNQRLSEAAAQSQARRMFLEDPVWASAIGIPQGLLWYVIVCVLIRSTEKRPCVLESVGLSPKGKRLVLVPLGFLLGLIMYFGYFAVGRAFGQPPFVRSPEKLAVLPLVLVSLDLLANGFGEEAAFRAYWQRLLVDRHGLWLGIALASTSFVLLHLLIAHFTVMALLAGILVACLFGILYVWTESIFLVGALHTTLNLGPRVLGPWPSDVSLLTVNGLALVIAVVLYARHAKAGRA